MVTLGHAVVADAEALDQPVDHLLAGHHADRPGQRSRLGDDGIGAHRDEVPTGCGDVAHRDDDGLAGPRLSAT